MDERLLISVMPDPADGADKDGKRARRASRRSAAVYHRMGRRARRGFRQARLKDNRAGVDPHYGCMVRLELDREVLQADNLYCVFREKKPTRPHVPTRNIKPDRIGWRRRRLRRKAAAGNLIPPPLRLAVTDILGAQYSTPEIDQLFKSEGWEVDADLRFEFDDSRKGRARAFDSVLDPTSPGDAEAYLQVVRHILARLRQEEVDANWPNEKAGPRAARERIEHELARAGIESDADGQLVLPSLTPVGPSLLDAPNESGIRLAISQLAQVNSEPEQRIGAAKELVEATIKFALEELGEAYDPKENLPALAKQLHRRMRLHPGTVAPTTDGADVLVRILGSITTIPQSLAELRNLGYGTGHGRSRRIPGIKPRHSDLAAGTAIAYASYILDTLSESGDSGSWTP